MTASSLTGGLKVQAILKLQIWALVMVTSASSASAFAQAIDDEPFERRRRRAADVDDEPEELQGQARRFRRRSAPSNQYVDPASFFRLHGYATLSYSSVDEELNGGAFRTPHILVSGISPRTGENEGGYRHDAAVFIGAEPFDGVSATVELHFVGNGLDPVLTEAKATWDFVTLEDNPYVAARVVGGRYWWPFGNHNGEWFSAVNRFSLVSVAAAEVVPAHYNEVGLMLEGELSFTESVGVNAALSVGNGVPSFELSDVIGQTAFDYDGDPALTARAALFVVEQLVQFEAGFSIASSTLREGPDGATGVDRFPNENDPRNFAADYLAYGIDVALQVAGFDLSGYYYASTENLDDAPVDKLDRQGVTGELGYRFDLDYRFFKAIGLAARVSYATEETIADGTQGWLQFGGAAYIQVTRTLTFRGSYMAQEESDDAPAIDNNLLTISMTAEF